MRKLLESKLKDVPPEQREKILSIIEKKPELLGQIATEAKQKMDQGMTQADAMMQVMRAHEAELRDAMN